MKCPACKAEVEDGADLCLECGEPMGDSPAAKLARQENVIRPPAEAFTPKPGGAPPVRGGVPTPPPMTRPSGAPPLPTGVPPKPPGATPGAAAPAGAAPTARKKWPTEEPEPKRCPGCGTKSHAARCPGCGTKLRSDDD